MSGCREEPCVERVRDFRGAWSFAQVMGRRSFRVVVVVMAFAVTMSSSAGAAVQQPTPLRLVERTASGVYTDGVRYAVVTAGRELVVLDTFTRTRRVLRGERCGVAGPVFFQTVVSAGRALLDCVSGPALLSLASGRISVLPDRVAVGGREQPAVYSELGAHWAVHGAGYCGEREGRNLYCTVYVNLRSHEQRVVARSYGIGGDLRHFRDIDDPDLARRTVCAPHGDVLREGQRTYEPPWLLDGGVLRRCGTPREVRALPEALPDLMNLSGGRVSWGDSSLEGSGRGYVYDTAGRRLYAWRAPRIGRRARPPVSAVHTRREVLIAATLTANEDGDPLTVRVYRARMPGTRPVRARSGRRCRTLGRTLLANRAARVYAIDEGEPYVFACAYRAARPRLDLGIKYASNGVSLLRLLGTTVAYRAAGEGCSRGECIGTYVESRDLISGRRLRRIFNGVDQYVVKANGSLAVAGPRNDLDPRLRLVKADRAGTSVLSEQIDRGSLTRAGSWIRWTENGTPHTATLD